MSFNGELIRWLRQSCRQLLLSATADAVTLMSIVAIVGVLSLPAKAVAGETNGSDAESSSLVKADPEQLLQEMVKAMESLNYIGEFVHVMESKLEAMHIVHASTEQGEFERLTSLNGEAREIFRNDEQLICIRPGSDSIIVSSAKERQTVPRIDAEVLQSEFYDAMHEGFDRVAGRDAHIISIMPVDQFRYGHRFWIDTKSNMLLRMTLVGSSGDVMDQFMFTSIQFPSSIDQTVFDTAHIENAFELPASKPVEETKTSLKLDGPAVSFDSLPGGYRKVAETYDPMPISDEPVSHVTITDGMASVSVYVEYSANADLDDSSMGLSSMGAVNAYTRKAGEALVTVVGEVPVAVIKDISQSIVLQTN